MKFSHGGKRGGGTKRGEDFLRSLGFATANVEKKTNIPGKIFFKNDAFGFADVIAVHPDYIGTLYVQLTTGENHEARKRKIEELHKNRDDISKILKAGNSIQVISWEKGVNGKRRVSCLEHAQTASWDERDLPTDRMARTQEFA